MTIKEMQYNTHQKKEHFSSYVVTSLGFKMLSQLQTNCDPITYPENWNNEDNFEIWGQSSKALVHSLLQEFTLIV